MKKTILALIIINIFIVSGCINSNNQTEQLISTDPQERCIQVCRELLSSGVNLNAGPCLSEMEGVKWDIEDWACDVAHNPRKSIDDSAINQCQEYKKGNVNHFVEVTPNCEFIRKL